jgi:hypothetical protein
MKKEEYNIPSWDEINQFTHNMFADMAKELDKQAYDTMFNSPPIKIPEHLFPYFDEISWNGEQSRMCKLCNKMVIPATLIVDSWFYLFCPDCHYCFWSYKITGESVPVSSECY